MGLALYRKYRPATFAAVVGQEHVTGPLSLAVDSGRINHAYLFSGPRGCGKTSSARILARSLNCEQGPTSTPCGVCQSCRDLAPDGSGNIDVIEIDAASHGGVDDARELRERAFQLPVASRYKIYIIDEAHMVTNQGFNALLKVVEEPPESVVFVFATTEPDKVLSTIRSRTHHYPFRLVPPATMRSLLERNCHDEGIAVEASVIPLVVRAGGGSVRDSQSLLDQLIAGSGDAGLTYSAALALLGVTDEALLDDMVEAIGVGDGATVFGTVERVVDAGHDPRRFASDLLDRLRDLILLRAVPGAADKGLLDVADDQLERMSDQASRLDLATLSRLADLVHVGLTEMRGTTAPRLGLELICARLLVPESGADAGALAQRLDRLERRLQIAEPVEAAGSPRARAEAAGRAPAAPSPGPAAPTATPRTAPPPAAPAVPVVEPVTPSRAAGSQPVRVVAPSAPPGAAATRTSAAPPKASSLSTTSAPPRTGLPRPEVPAAAAPTPSADGWPEIAVPGAKARPTGEAPTAPPVTTAPESAAAVAAPPAPPSAARTETDSAAGSSPPVETPTEAPPVAVPGAEDFDAAAVRRIWPDVVEAAKRRSKVVGGMAGSMSAVSIEGNVLTVTAPPGLGRRLANPTQRAPLEAALGDVLGVTWTITTTTVEESPSEAEPDPRDEEVDSRSSAGERVSHQDPEAAALDLLRSELGASPLDP